MITFISLEIFNKNSKRTHSRGSKSKRRILRFFEAKKSKDSLCKIMVKYSDGKTNEGSYESTKDLLLALHAFTEEGL